ncbi:MAG: glycine betaine ABC transporter substrate-binding protein [Terriglobia bacterium]
MRRTVATLCFAASFFSLACQENPGNRIRVGSKNFTEQIILAELLKQYLERRTNLQVETRTNLGGTLVCHEAARSGEIDLYVEYAGTALTAVLGEPPGGNPEEVFRRVKSGYAERFGLEVLDPLGFSNTFAIVVRGEDARRLRLKTISDAAQKVPAWRAGFGYEFMERQDGFPGLEKTYNLHLKGSPRTMELGLLYRALMETQVDLVAGNATDGIISASDLVILEDDRHYFPPYDALPIVGRKVLEQHPELGVALRGLAGKISEEEMRRMNYAVDGLHREVRQVAAEFLRAKRLE